MTLSRREWDVIERERVEWVANTAAEDGDPDVMELGMRALEGDEHCIGECLHFWELWAWKRQDAERLEELRRG